MHNCLYKQCDDDAHLLSFWESEFWYTLDKGCLHDQSPIKTLSNRSGMSIPGWQHFTYPIASSYCRNSVHSLKSGVLTIRMTSLVGRKSKCWMFNWRYIIYSLLKQNILSFTDYFALCEPSFCRMWSYKGKESSTTVTETLACIKNIWRLCKDTAEPHPSTISWFSRSYMGARICR